MAHPSESGHWYTRAGEPCYEVEGKPTTLRHARKLNLVPSVTTVLQMEAKPMLTNWMIKQAVLSALTLPRLEGESIDAFSLRVEEDRQAQVRLAADKGTKTHAALQHFFETGAIDFAYGREIVAVRDWIHQRYGKDGWRAEQSFAHPSGYGGKTDLLGLGIVIDFKTKDFGEDKEARDLAWPEHICQLAAYGDGFGFERPDCVNVFVSTRHPGLIRVREWDNAEIAEGREVFQLLLKLWKLRRKYNPAFVSGEIAA